ncbi:hypothetical protein E3N88_14682 [Mikania micrantha]|uniref:Myosin N-terminal SH3-like domain-containing protein n=1 Tax=Mikania micrantha TaxID=192012 RepID=A0A5N6P2E2_9ASTR|nr:hypothetical protein E3N88_14682 [Mikania micrantha]
MVFYECVVEVMVETQMRHRSSADGGGGRGQIKLHGVVELVGVDAVDLGDFVIAVGGKAVEKTVEEFDYGESELRRDDSVKVFDFDDINDSFAVMSNSNGSMSLRKSSKVWVEDRDTAWVAGEITGFAGKHVQVVTEFGKQILAFAEKLLLRDADADYGGVDDMTKLAYLNEPGVLDNLKKLS